MQNIYDNIRTLEITTKRLVTELFSGNYKSSFHGSGIEVEDLRPYEFGDNAKLIDWTATAKLGEPYVKKFRESRELSTFVIVDISSSMNFTSVDGVRKSDRVLEAVAILLFSAIKNGESVGAIIFSEKIEKFIPSRKGRKHALVILHEIASYYNQTEKCDKKGNFKIALEQFNKTVKKHPICFVISDQEDWGDENKKALNMANLKNDLVYIHIEDPFEREITDNTNIALSDMEGSGGMEFMLGSERLRKEYKVLREEKESIRRETLKKLKIDSITLSTDKQVFPEFLRFFKYRQQKVI